MGHFHAMLKIASKIKNADWEVIYGSQPILKKDVEKHNFGFQSLPGIPVVNVNFAHRQASILHFSHYFFNIFNHEKIHLTQKSIKEFEEIICDISPDLVLLDEQSALKSLFYQRIGIPVIVFQTKPDTRQIKTIPPFTSYFLPKFNFFSSYYCDILWKITLIKYHFNKGWSRLLSFGQDNYSILKKVLKEEGINMNKHVDLRRSFCMGIKGVPRLIISPKAFDFPHPEKEGIFRIGPLIDVKREGIITLPRYQIIRTKLEKEKQKPECFVIYCSMGTITSSFKKRVKKFFLKIANVATINPHFIFIISTGNNFDINELLPAPENIYIFNHIPQVDLLHYCDIMITHGGMNSITECVFIGVPMLVYPLSPHWDQPGNSARVVYHKLGLRGKINIDSASEISKKINILKSNYDFYKQKVLAMKANFEKKNLSDEVLKIIEKSISKKQKKQDE